MKNDKNEANDTEKIVKSVTKEFVVVYATPLKSFSKEKETKVERKHNSGEKQHPAFKERQEKICPFPDSHVVYMLKPLLKKQLIPLWKSKQLEQTEKIDYPNYCKYHLFVY